MDILIVEDNEQHRTDAKSCLETLLRQEYRGRIDYARTLKEAQALLTTQKYDGIMSDVYFPVEEGDPETMSGTEVGQYALEHSIPFVLVTDSYHHGEKAQAACTWIRERGWTELVDLPKELAERNGNARPKKNWTGALFALVSLIEGMQTNNVQLGPKGITGMVNQDYDVGAIFRALDRAAHHHQVGSTVNQQLASLQRGDYTALCTPIIEKYFNA